MLLESSGFSAREVSKVRFVALILILVATGVPVMGKPRAEQMAGEGIPEGEITRLQEQLVEVEQIESTVERRRVLKRIARDSQALIKAHADAPNRFQLLGLSFQAQQELLVLRNDADNREALLVTAGKLLEAPFDYAAERLDAEVLLMQLELDRKGATEHERAVAIAELADRYRGTPGEADSLIVASELAFNLGQAELLGAIRSTLARKFRENPKAIGFLKDRFASKSSSLMFRGRFQRLDGEEMVLPIDRAGHVYLACFWSARLNDLKERLMTVKDLQRHYPGRFEVFSFNLDELPDAGKSTLNALGLDWTPMRLPGGSNHALFRACGADPQFLIRIINANGYIILTPIGSTYRTYGRVTDLPEYLRITLDEAPFLSMMQTLRIGEFLLSDPFPAREGEPADEDLRAIRACFVAPSMRYRLSREQAMANYAKAARLCAELLQQRPGAGTPWSVHNHRIIALLGLWNLSGEPRFLREAVGAAHAVLAMDMPREAQRVPRFCLAKEALRQAEADAEAVLSDFMAATGGDPTRGLSVGAAAVLSLDAGSPVLFEGYREELLNGHLDNPQMWPLTAPLFNRFVVARLFRGNYYAADVRVYHGFRSWQNQTETRPRKFLMKLSNLEGAPLEFPHRDQDKSNVVLFMEPPADEASAGIQVDFVESLNAIAKAHTHTNVNVVIVFVSENTNSVLALVEKNGWDPETIAMVPGGLKNPHVVRLGIFLTDKRPNTFVVAPDGTIRWSMSGMYQMAVGVNAVSGSVMEQIRAHDLNLGETALKEGDFRKALRLYGGSFPPNPRASAELRNVLSLGRARACMGLKQWQEALKAFDAMVAGHTRAACLSPCACQSLARKLRQRADLLEKLGRTTEAAADRQRAEHLACPRDGKIRFHADRYEQEISARVQGLMLREDWDAALGYIDDIIVHGKDGRQKEREELAGLLREHALILAQLGEKAKARDHRQWADALTQGIEIEVADGDGGPQQAQRYVDVVMEAE